MIQRPGAFNQMGGENVETEGSGNNLSGNDLYAIFKHHECLYNQDHGMAASSSLHNSGS